MGTTEREVAKGRNRGLDGKQCQLFARCTIEAAIDEGTETPSQTVVPAHFTASLLSSCHIPAARIAQSLFLEFLVRSSSELSLDSSLVSLV